MRSYVEYNNYNTFIFSATNNFRSIAKMACAQARPCFPSGPIIFALLSFASLVERERRTPTARGNRLKYRRVLKSISTDMEGHAMIEVAVWKNALFPTVLFIQNLGSPQTLQKRMFLFSCSKCLNKGGGGSYMNAVFTACLDGWGDIWWEYNHHYYQINQLKFGI